MPLDDFLDLTIDRGQCADQQRRAGSPRRPFGAGKTLAPAVCKAKTFLVLLANLPGSPLQLAKFPFGIEAISTSSAQRVLSVAHVSSLQ
jgi:hypothetical protein